MRADMKNSEPQKKAAIAPSSAASRRVLLICSEFFSYQNTIADQLRRLGYEVTTWSDRTSSNTIYKLMLRKLSWLTGTCTARSFLRKAAQLPFDHYQHILIVKGEGLSRRAVSGLNKRFPGARKSLYLWDAATNTPNSARIATLVDHVATFDRHDALRYGWKYRPLFAVPRNTFEIGDHKFDWSFVGTIHSDRGQIIQDFQKTTQADAKSFVFGYFPSRLLYWFHIIRNPGLLNAPAGQWSLTPIPTAEAAKIISASRAVLDIEHPDQTGITIRSIEVLLAGRKLITTNEEIKSSRLFDPSRVCVIDRYGPKLDSDFLNAPFAPLSPEVVYAYSLESWARNLLGLPQRMEVGPF
jgi:hypothetical protein